MVKFKGFSTVNRVKPPYTIMDGELIKRDLLNEFYTRRGERVMRPTYGSIIWELLMDPSTPQLETTVREDIEKITGRDPRVRTLNTRVFVLDHTVRVEIDLVFVATGGEDTLYLNYTRNITEGTN